MKIKKPLFTPYQLGVLAILEGGGRIEFERMEDDFWEGFLHDCNGEYCGLVTYFAVEKMEKCGKIKIEEETPDYKIYLAVTPINDDQSR